MEQLQFEFVFRDEAGNLRPEYPRLEGGLWRLLAEHLAPLSALVEAHLIAGRDREANVGLIALTDALYAVYDEFAATCARRR